MSALWRYAVADNGKHRFCVFDNVVVTDHDNLFDNDEKSHRG